MSLEQHVTTLETSKILHSLGVRQESLFYWASGEICLYEEIPWVSSKYINTGGCGCCGRFDEIKEIYSALTMSELLELLPDTIVVDEQRYRLIITKGGVCYSTQNKYEWLKGFSAGGDYNDTLLNCLAKMLIHLLENKLLGVSK